MPDDAKTFLVENARLIYRNFSGIPTTFNPAGGKRTFGVVLDKPMADILVADGWNVKCKPANVDSEEGTDEFCFIEVTIGYKVHPPKVVILTDSSRTQLSEDMVGMLDWADIRTVDLIARSYEWNVSGKSGIKAYLKSMFVTIEEDELERKYALMDTEGGE